MVVDHPATLVGLGDITDLPVLLAALGFIAMVILGAYKVRGGIVFSILSISVLGGLLGITEFHGAIDGAGPITPGR